MTASAAGGEGEATPTRPGRRSGRRWIVAGVLVLATVGLVLAYTSWWTRPTTFGGVGNGFGFRQTTDDMHPVTVDMVQRSAHADPETVTLHDVRPRVGTNTADAVITLAVCRRGEDSIFMSSRGPAERSCETLTEVGGQQVQLTGDATTTITMTVTPRRQGRVVIRGIDVDYTRGPGHLWQRGTEATGPVVTVNVRK